MNFPTIAITSGEPAGIGPDLVLTLKNKRQARYVLIGDKAFLHSRAKQLGLAVVLHDYQPDARAPEFGLEVCQVDLNDSKVCAGVLNVANASYVLATIERAIDGCLRGEFAALVTAPIHKGIINDSGINFSGHTEYLAARTNTRRVVMMLVGGNMRVALATTHLALREVADAISRESLSEIIHILHHDLRKRFGIAQPRILVAGLNPHAGEGGHLGREELDIINPLLKQLRAEGMDLTGALSADTLFNPEKLNAADAVLAMYHDQGLPVLKYASFGSGVNVTLGLPIIRTSVDHGTALELAGTGNANVGSLHSALALAEELALSAKK